jgi:hypothetical protein
MVILVKNEAGEFGLRFCCTILVIGVERILKKSVSSNQKQFLKNVV